MNKALTFLALFALTLLISSTGFAESHENPPEIKTVSLGEFQIHLLSEGDQRLPIPWLGPGPISRARLGRRRYSVLVDTCLAEVGRGDFAARSEKVSLTL